MKKPNQDLRDFIKKSKIYAYQIAEHLQIHENSWFRMLRRELSPEKKKELIEIIEMLIQAVES